MLRHRKESQDLPKPIYVSICILLKHPSSYACTHARSAILSSTGPGSVIQMAGLWDGNLVRVPLGNLGMTTYSMTREEIFISAVSVRPVGFYYFAGPNFQAYKSGGWRELPSGTTTKAPSPCLPR